MPKTKQTNNNQQPPPKKTNKTQQQVQTQRNKTNQTTNQKNITLCIKKTKPHNTKKQNTYNQPQAIITNTSILNYK